MQLDDAEINVKMNLAQFIQDLREMAEVYRAIAKVMTEQADKLEQRATT